MSNLLDTAIDLGATHIANAVKAWDKQDVEELLSMLNDLDEFCDLHDIDRQHYVDMTSLPSADIPKDVDTSWQVWAIDVNDGMLVGSEANETMTLDEYREANAA